MDECKPLLRGQELVDAMAEHHAYAEGDARRVMAPMLDAIAFMHAVGVGPGWHAQIAHNDFHHMYAPYPDHAMSRTGSTVHAEPVSGTL